MNKKSPQIIKLLPLFTKKERSNFEAFIKSPYFNKNKTIINLYQLLRKIICEDGRRYDEEIQQNIYTTLFPNDKVKDSGLSKKQRDAFNKHMSNLLGLSKSFLSHEALKENGGMQINLLLKNLIKKEAFEVFDIDSNKEKKILDSKKEEGKVGIDYYTRRMNLDLNIFESSYIERTLTQKHNIAEIDKSLDITYILKKLEFYLTYLSLLDYADIKSNQFVHKFIDSLTEAQDYAENILIKVYQASIILMKSKGDKDADRSIYENFMEMLKKNKNKIPKYIMNDMYIVSTNYCTLQIYVGNDYHIEMYQLYEIMDKNELLMENGFMPEIKLKNLITVACRVGEYEWAREMLKKYGREVKKRIRGSVINYNLGYIEFYEGKFEEAQGKFYESEKVELAYDLDGKIMLIKTMYEIDAKNNKYDERFNTQLRSTQSFVKGKKQIQSGDRKRYLNFITTLIQIYSVFKYVDTTGKIMNKADDKTIRNRILRASKDLSQKEYSDKTWLSKKIADLEDRFLDKT